MTYETNLNLGLSIFISGIIALWTVFMFLFVVQSGFFIFVTVVCVIIIIICSLKLSRRKKIAREWLNLLTKENIFLGTDAWNDLSVYQLEKLASCCKRNSTSILLPGIQFNEMESAKDVNNEKALRKVSDLHLKNLIIIEGMNYTPSSSAPCDTIEALVKFAEKAISEKTPFTFITDDPSLIVRLKCFQDDKFVHIESAGEVGSMLLVSS